MRRVKKIIYVSGGGSEYEKASEAARGDLRESLYRSLDKGSADINMIIGTLTATEQNWMEIKLLVDRYWEERGKEEDDTQSTEEETPSEKLDYYQDRIRKS